MAGYARNRPPGVPVETHYRHFNKRITKSPKLHLFDTGPVCTLPGIRETKKPRFHRQRGHRFGNPVVTELWKGTLNRGEEPDQWFWHNSQGHVGAAVLDAPDGLSVFQVKATAAISPALLDGMSYHHLKQGEGGYTLVHTGQGDHRLAGMRVVCWQEPLAAIGSTAAVRHITGPERPPMESGGAQHPVRAAPGEAGG